MRNILDRNTAGAVPEGLRPFDDLPTKKSRRKSKRLWDVQELDAYVEGLKAARDAITSVARGIVRGGSARSEGR